MAEERFNITIDGQAAEAREGETLLEVCRRLGKDIPTLCHHEAIEPYAACRVCLVEVTAGGRPSLVPSCQYPVSDGLAVETASPAVAEARRTVLELLLARCPESEVIRELAGRYGVTETPYPTDDPAETCILCGLCVRVCDELVGQSAIGFSSRGIDRRVGSPLEERSEACIGCGACVAVCPTGHVQSEVDGGVLRLSTWLTELPLACCISCGKPFATERQVERLVSDVPAELADVVRTCPVCRARAAGRKWSQATRLASAVGAVGRASGREGDIHSVAMERD